MMATFRSVFASSIGTKLLIGLTGLGLVLYLVLHLAGNILYFFGPDLFNSYSHTLISNPLIVPIEIGLGIIFLVHIYKTVRMWMDNQRARPIGYAQKRSAGYTSRKGIASSTMIVTGLATLLFVVIHLKQFKYGALYLVADTEVRDLYRLETEIFSNPVWVAAYVAGMILIGFHLRHGVSSAFQSLGLEHPRYTQRILVAGLVMAIILAGGLGVIPVWVYFTR
jgi:succinate dehydrogenase / fumarate reductase cytochrome b subunit